MSTCNHDCKSCKSKCENDSTKFLVKTSEQNHIRKIIGVVSGKGGVGKSATTSLLAVACAKMGYKVGIMDADITGPSIPQAFGLKDGLVGDGDLMYPGETSLGIKVVSINLLLDDPTKPVVWRGPVIGGAVKQFYTDVLWEDLDFLFVDMPPGTGDVALTVFQSLPIDGVIIVSTPQDLVEMIVKKAVNMADMMHIKVLGLVENMSYFTCPDCGKKIELFGPSKFEAVAKELNIAPLAQFPIDPELARLVDAGEIENYELPDLTKVFDMLESM